MVMNKKTRYRAGYVFILIFVSWLRASSPPAPITTGTTSGISAPRWSAS